LGETRVLKAQPCCLMLLPSEGRCERVPRRAGADRPVSSSSAAASRRSSSGSSTSRRIAGGTAMVARTCASMRARLIGRPLSSSITSGSMPSSPYASCTIPLAALRTCGSARVQRAHQSTRVLLRASGDASIPSTCRSQEPSIHPSNTSTGAPRAQPSTHSCIDFSIRPSTNSACAHGGSREWWNMQGFLWRENG
jgi:hypothetical protein